MTEQNPPSSGAGAESGSGDSKQPAPEPPRRAAGGGKVLGIVALLVSIAAASVTGYLWYQVQVEQRLSQNQELTEIKNSVNVAQVGVTSLEKELAGLREQHKELSARVENQVQARLNELQSQQDKLAERSEALSDAVEKVYEDLDRSLDSWALEEVEQLLRIANHSLRLSHDVSTAVAALELADKRLQEIGNPAFLEVRERLADNIAALKSVEPIDIAGLTLRLSGMAARVQDLPLAQETQRPIKGEGGGDGGQPSDWLEAGGELINDLKKLVRIQNIEKAPEPLLAPEQRYFLFHNLRLMLSGAQIAALRRDTATFSDNLDRAANWTREYFDTGHKGVQQLLDGIQSMSNIELNPQLPDISGSLGALQDAKKRMTEQ